MTPDFAQRFARVSLFAAAAAVLLTACADQGAYAPPGFAFLTRYHAAASNAPVQRSDSVWWTGFGDPVFDRLVDQALRGNISLQAARARVDEARASAAATPGLGSLSTAFEPIASGVPGGVAVGSGSTTLTLGWILDPFGAQKARKNADLATIDVAQAELASARLLLLYNLGNAYVDLRYRQSVQALRQQEMRGRQQTLAMTRTLLQAKDATRLDITRSEARVAELQAQMPGLAAAIAAKKNEIAVLTGVAPGALAVDLDRNPGQPRPRRAPKAGIPADLVRNRPDIIIAERRYYIALTGLTEAEAARYPSLSLNGVITLNSAEGGRSGTDYYFGPVLQLPTLPGKAARAGVDQAKARIASAHAEWKSTVLSALLEVENALLDYQAASTSLTSADKATRLYRESLDLTRQVFAEGDATLGDLIDAEQSLANAEQAQAETLYQRGLSFVALNVRLGEAPAAGEAQPTTP
jgi:multidrug efflux system outer membrane protein